MVPKRTSILQKGPGDCSPLLPEIGSNRRRFQTQNFRYAPMQVNSRSSTFTKSRTPARPPLDYADTGGFCSASKYAILARTHSFVSTNAAKKAVRL